MPFRGFAPRTTDGIRPMSTSTDKLADSMKALVVDDSGSMRTIVTRILEALGVEEILEADNGRDAIALLEDGNLPDVALVDWHMPVMNGCQFVSTVRERLSWRRMAIMMMTTENEHDEIVQALAAGATEYLIKPFTPEALIHKLSLLGLNPMAGVTAA